MNVLEKLIADTLKQKNTQALEVCLRQPLNPHYLEIMLKALERRWFSEKDKNIATESFRLCVEKYEKTSYWQRNQSVIDTMFRHAARRGELELLQILLPIANASNNDCFPVRLALEYGHRDCAKFLLPYSNPDDVIEYVMGTKHEDVLMEISRELTAERECQIIGDNLHGQQNISKVPRKI